MTGPANHGTFPFGRAVLECPPRRPDGPAQVFILGVYPSALHVRWDGPLVDGRWAKVSALAVDNEPVCFWDGRDAAQRIDAWKAEVGFRDGGSWGTVALASTNGSSGKLITSGVLEPLGIESGAAWMTDAIPWFFVKYSAGKGREQGDAIRESYAPFAEATRAPTADIPTRPSTKELVALAVKSQRERIRNELLESQAPLVITVGQEAWDALVGVVDAADIEGKKLDSERYAQRGSVRVDGMEFEWLPLAHPGVVRRPGRWQTAHETWSSGLAKP